MDHNTPFGPDSPADFISDLEYFQKNQIFHNIVFSKILLWSSTVC